MRLLILGACILALAVTACIKNPVVPEDDDDDGDGSNDSIFSSISERAPGENADLPPVRFTLPD